MLLELVGLCRDRMSCRAYRLNLNVNHRVMGNPTLCTMTVLPETPLINPVCGVSGDSSDNGGPRCTHVNRPDTLLSEQNGHHLDLQLRFRCASPHHCDRT